MAYFAPTSNIAVTSDSHIFIGQTHGLYVFVELNWLLQLKNSNIVVQRGRALVTRVLVHSFDTILGLRSLASSCVVLSNSDAESGRVSCPSGNTMGCGHHMTRTNN